MVRRAAGFTFMEMVVVMTIIALIAAIAVPQLLPAIVFSNHEGAARHLAGFGRAAIGYAGLMHEKVTIKFDLSTQEYWAERWPNPPELDEEGNPVKDKPELSQLEMMQLARAAMEGDKEVDTKALDEESERMRKRFDGLQRQAVTTLAERVEQDQDVVDGLADFLGEFALKKDQEIPPPEEIFGGMLGRQPMREGVYIEAVSVGGVEYSSGLVEIDIAPSGLGEQVAIFVVNDDGDYYTVEWDPIINGARLRVGRETTFNAQ
jgi:prepilin-type N-terminal cleavage/methylation domain-containing protein